MGLEPHKFVESDQRTLEDSGSVFVVGLAKDGGVVDLGTPDVSVVFQVRLGQGPSGFWEPPCYILSDGKDGWGALPGGINRWTADGRQVMTLRKLHPYLTVADRDQILRIIADFVRDSNL